VTWSCWCSCCRRWERRDT